MMATHFFFPSDFSPPTPDFASQHRLLSSSSLYQVQMLPMMKIIDQSLAKPFWTFFPILTLKNSCLVKSSHYLSIHSHAYIQTTAHTMRKKECHDPCYHSEDHSSQMSTRNFMAISLCCSSELTPVSQLYIFFCKDSLPILLNLLYLALYWQAFPCLPFLSDSSLGPASWSTLFIYECHHPDFL